MNIDKNMVPKVSEVLEQELSRLINATNREPVSNTPDFILAKFLVGGLLAIGELSDMPSNIDDLFKGSFEANLAALIDEGRKELKAVLSDKDVILTSLFASKLLQLFESVTIERDRWHGFVPRTNASEAHVLIKHDVTTTA